MRLPIIVSSKNSWQQLNALKVTRKLPSGAQLVLHGAIKLQQELPRLNRALEIYKYKYRAIQEYSEFKF